MKLNTQRVLLVILVSVAFFGFLLWSIQQTQSEEETLYGNSNLSVQTPLENKFISVAAPKENSVIQSPVTISGQANVSGNRLKVRLKDQKGLVLGESFVQTKNAKAMSDFSISLKYKKASATKGTVEIFLVSSKDNSEIYKITVPVIFKN